MDIVAWAIIVGSLAWAWKGADMRPIELWTSRANLVEYASGYFPPSFRDYQFMIQESVDFSTLGR